MLPRERILLFESGYRDTSAQPSEGRTYYVVPGRVVSYVERRPAPGYHESASDILRPTVVTQYYVGVRPEEAREVHRAVRVAEGLESPPPKPAEVDVLSREEALLGGRPQLPNVSHATATQPVTTTVEMSLEEKIMHYHAVTSGALAEFGAQQKDPLLRTLLSGLGGFVEGFTALFSPATYYGIYKFITDPIGALSRTWRAVTSDPGGAGARLAGNVAGALAFGKLFGYVTREVRYLRSSEVRFVEGGTEKGVQWLKGRADVAGFPEREAFRTSTYVTLTQKGGTATLSRYRVYVHPKDIVVRQGQTMTVDLTKGIRSYWSGGKYAHLGPTWEVVGKVSGSGEVTQLMRHAGGGGLAAAQAVTQSLPVPAGTAVGYTTSPLTRIAPLAALGTASTFSMSRMSPFSIPRKESILQTEKDLHSPSRESTPFSMSRMSPFSMSRNLYLHARAAAAARSLPAPKQPEPFSISRIEPVLHIEKVEPFSMSRMSPFSKQRTEPFSMSRKEFILQVEKEDTFSIPRTFYHERTADVASPAPAPSPATPSVSTPRTPRKPPEGIKISMPRITVRGLAAGYAWRRWRVGDLLKALRW